MEQSQLVQRASQRLRDMIARRETTLDLEAIKAVLVEMATQKERADRLEKQFADECETSRNLEKLNELMTLDFERERTENARLRKALNQIAMSAMSSEYAKGRAAIALQGE